MGAQPVTSGTPVLPGMWRRASPRFHPRVLSIGVVLPLGALALGGCPQAARTARFVGPESYLLPESPTGALAQVHVTTGYGDEPEQPYRAEAVTLEGRSWASPVTVTSLGSVRITPTTDDAQLELWVRHTGLEPTGFQPLPVVTGALERSIPLELRPLPSTLHEELVIPLSWLHNVYNGFSFEDGDLLLIALSHEEQPPERYLFRTRRLGLRSKLGAGLLVRTPLPEVTADPLAPVFAGTLAVGYRPRTRSPAWSWAGDKLAVVVSLGIGTTQLPDTSDTVDQQLGSLYDAALGGGGIELYDIVSVQILANLTAMGRDASEARGTLAVGFDAVQFGRFTRHAAQRLLKRNTLE